MKRPFKFQIYKNKKNRMWYWRLKAGNGKIIANGEGYHNKKDVYKVVNFIYYLSGQQVYTEEIK